MPIHRAGLDICRGTLEVKTLSHTGYEPLEVGAEYQVAYHPRCLLPSIRIESVLKKVEEQRQGCVCARPAEVRIWLAYGSGTKQTCPSIWGQKRTCAPVMAFLQSFSSAARFARAQAACVWPSALAVSWRRPTRAGIAASAAEGASIPIRRVWGHVRASCADRVWGLESDPRNPVQAHSLDATYRSGSR